jgi:hypothetical protein
LKQSINLKGEFEVRKELQSKHRKLSKRMTQKQLKSRLEKIKKKREKTIYDGNAIESI